MQGSRSLGLRARPKLTADRVVGFNRWHRPCFQQAPDVLPCPAGDHRQHAPLPAIGERSPRITLIEREAVRRGRVEEQEKVMGHPRQVLVRGCGRTNPHPAVDLPAVGVDHFAPETQRHLDRGCRLARGRWSGDDDRSVHIRQARPRRSRRTGPPSAKRHPPAHRRCRPATGVPPRSPGSRSRRTGYAPGPRPPHRSHAVQTG